MSEPGPPSWQALFTSFAKAQVLRHKVPTAVRANKSGRTSAVRLVISCGGWPRVQVKACSSRPINKSWKFVAPCRAPVACNFAHTCLASLSAALSPSAISLSVRAQAILHTLTSLPTPSRVAIPRRQINPLPLTPFVKPVPRLRRRYRARPWPLRLPDLVAVAHVPHLD